MAMVSAVPIAPGVVLWREKLSREEQSKLVDEVFERARRAPFYRPTMPRSAKPFSVEETNFGPLGWFSDQSGYRYVQQHPLTNQRWPAIPDRLLDLWSELSPYPAPPECCLVNLYREGARMGLHQDRDEAAMDAPVLSVSLGDDALFRIGGPTRNDPTRSILLVSGDVVVFGGPARLAYHGIDRIIAGTSTLLPQRGRLNLTLRRVTHATKKTPDQGADRASDAPLRAGVGRG
jgi:alkylated DNA repair protein (DNA oxidative demethylase)